MSRRASPAAVGGFVLGAIVIGIAAVVYFSRGAVLAEKLELVTYFPGSVSGLRVGAPVEFQGVQIGQVSRVQLIYRDSTAETFIPVYLEIWPRTVVLPEGRDDTYDNDFQRLIQNRGLRTRLESQSLVTGQFNVTLNFFPDSEIRLVGHDPNTIEIPAVESTRDRLEGFLGRVDLDKIYARAMSTLESVEALLRNPAIEQILENANAAVADTRVVAGVMRTRVGPLVDRVDATLEKYAGLARSTEERLQAVVAATETTLASVRDLSGSMRSQVKPLSGAAAAAIDEGAAAMREMRQLVDHDSATRQNLDVLMEEAAGAARSLRILADYLEQNPDALIRGKY